jgi:hypothetical protein
LPARDSARAPAVLLLQQLRILLERGGAGAGGQHDVVEGLAGGDGLLGQGAGIVQIAAVVRGLTAAGLGGDFHAAAGLLQQLHRGEADIGPHQIDQAGNE